MLSKAGPLPPYRRGAAVFKTAPSGRAPSLKTARARSRAYGRGPQSILLPAPNRRSYHCERALSGWKRRQAQAISIAMARICRLPALAIPVHGVTAHSDRASGSGQPTRPPAWASGSRRQALRSGHRGAIHANPVAGAPGRSPVPPGGARARRSSAPASGCAR